MRVSTGGLHRPPDANWSARADLRGIPHEFRSMPVVANGLEAVDSCDFSGSTDEPVDASAHGRQSIVPASMDVDRFRGTWENWETSPVWVQWSNCRPDIPSNPRESNHVMRGE